MFALSPVEVTLVVVWLVGIGASIYVGPKLSTQRRRIGLVLLAIVVPVVGALIALAVTVSVLRERRGPARPLRRVTRAGYGNPRD